MNSLAGSCEFSDLRPGDEVEFLMTYSQRTHKHSAIHVKKLRYKNNLLVSMLNMKEDCGVCADYCTTLL